MDIINEVIKSIKYNYCMMTGFQLATRYLSLTDAVTISHLLNNHVETRTLWLCKYVNLFHKGQIIGNY